MVPTLNVFPGELVEVELTREPELSVAVGSVHVTATPLDPTGIATLMFSGQPVITGSTLSTVAKIQMTWVMKCRCG